ncbi:MULTISPECIES: hypothetical protein [unclassified Streptomyces]|uniref:hypothetical protein n=1 Tax=unclassified Streptomyces TaxID=2593676 RepID=UPI002E13FEC6|nr:hypothetical protein OG452_07155 [Streptomyces sp. NBC_01197]WSS52197.1 hypothetical protein OG708_28335 [Streptomyces sp. NBC_01180]
MVQVLLAGLGGRDGPPALSFGDFDQSATAKGLAAEFVPGSFPRAVRAASGDPPRHLLLPFVELSWHLNSPPCECFTGMLSAALRLARVEENGGWQAA